ncbi:MAG: WbqC family protein [Chitinophagales bacterium]
MNSNKQPTAILMDTNYLAPVALFAEVESFSTVIFNTEQKFRKSTWQNRCKIAGANGPILLTVPLEGGRGTRKMIKDVRISYEQRWQQVHWNSICSAYRKSSYFEYYEDQFRPFYEKQYLFLMDLNVDLLTMCFRILSMGCEIKPSDGPLQADDENSTAFISKPKFNVVPYYQVFQERHGFIAEVSIIDLIFNMGPESKAYLQKIK